jgi:type IV pilus assembly protein PilC
MALLVLPGQFACRSEFYHQLRQLTAAGLGLIAALEQLKRNPPARSYREPISRLLEQLAAGYTVSESLMRVGQWLPEFDIALIHAGEQSGRLDACFGLLADYYQGRARLARQVIADLAYPVGLFHFAIFIFPFVQFFMSGNLLRYLQQTFGVLIPIYLVVGLIIYAGQSRHGEKWRGLFEQLLRPIPILGTARHYLALSRLAASLEALISAGVGILEAWELAATASGSPSLQRTVIGWRHLVNAGQSPAEVIVTSSKFPELFSNQYTTGEISGKLDDTLRRLRQYYEEEGSRKLHAVAQWTPRAVYFMVAIMIAVWVVRQWTVHFQQIRDAGGF